MTAARRSFDERAVNAYLAAKGHLHPLHPAPDAVQATRDLVALHSTGAAVPYLSLWARLPRFVRSDLDRPLYEERTLARLVCMRSTLFVVPSDDFALFYRACAAPLQRANRRLLATLITQAGLCPPEEADAKVEELQRLALAVVAPGEGSTVAEVVARVPELRRRVEYGVGRAYAAEISLGSRLVPGMCVEGLLVRTRPRGTWRGNLWRYARLADWLPGVNLDAPEVAEARTWLVRQYLRAFGPATAADAQWWTGLAKGDITRALERLGDEVVTVAMDGLGDDYLMLAEDASRLAAFAVPGDPYVSLLPALDPYIMGYKDRRRFLDPAQRTTVFDAAGNARPTVWAGGRVVGTWREVTRGRPSFDLFAPVTTEEQALLDRQMERLAEFLGGAGS